MYQIAPQKMFLVFQPTGTSVHLAFLVLCVLAGTRDAPIRMSAGEAKFFAVKGTIYYVTLKKVIVS